MKIRPTPGTSVIAWDTFLDYLGLVVRKPDFSICENKGADRLRGDREADQRLCFRYMDSTIPLLLKSENPLAIFSDCTARFVVSTWSETPKTGFLITRHIWSAYVGTYMLHARVEDKFQTYVYML